MQTDVRPTPRAAVRWAGPIRQWVVEQDPKRGDRLPDPLNPPPGLCSPCVLPVGLCAPAPRLREIAEGQSPACHHPS